MQASLSAKNVKTTGGKFGGIFKKWRAEVKLCGDDGDGVCEGGGSRAEILLIGVVGTLTLFRNLVPPPLPTQFFRRFSPLPLDILCMLNHILLTNFVKNLVTDLALGTKNLFKYGCQAQL